MINHFAKTLGLLAFISIGVLGLTSCDYQQKSQLERIKDKGYIKVYSRISPTTMSVGESGFSGFEYELVKLFAEDLGVRVEIVTHNDIAKILSEVEEGKVDFAAAGLTVTKQRQERLRFGPPYQSITSKLVYLKGTKRPRDFSQVDEQLTVIGNSSHSEDLYDVQEDYPNLSWTERSDLTTQDLLDQVLSGEIKYTIVDSNELDLMRQVQPELAVAFSVSEPEDLAWVFSKSEDNSLFIKVIEFFSRIREDGTLSYLIERYYGHLSKFDYVGSRAFHRAIESKLPEFKPFFYEAAGDDLDWRFLAAMGYQESHWNPKARSPTGVRGLMMLTQDTSRQLGIENRIDAEQSIMGGAEYFRLMKDKIPDRISDPDRTWFALAGYNVGFGHLEDARRLAQKAGENPDKWLVVKKFLPLLRQKKWYSQTRFGYARGDEPVKYVNNIRRYYQVLKKLEEPKPGAAELVEEEPEENDIEPADEVIDEAIEDQGDVEEEKQ
ncbi:membrane-bound lytic murein transglycosylase MltF [Kangiella sediminilitoris]|uniref:Membrane-bound lytic murein transglycosylase F n=1 Tax=Kangiella sediminilitoris TaxID=1144748 RepID=A0A1B3B9C9_9GAMM|nr:membrane-bound lytic murein transglycosylase MltF [Kangiella sediminilitoris]AOE49414.1 transglycosylase [Kangiella sediminilitoris]